MAHCTMASWSSKISFSKIESWFLLPPENTLQPLSTPGPTLGARSGAVQTRPAITLWAGGLVASRRCRALLVWVARRALFSQSRTCTHDPSTAVNCKVRAGTAAVNCKVSMRRFFTTKESLGFTRVRALSRPSPSCSVCLAHGSCEVSVAMVLVSTPGPLRDVCDMVKCGVIW
ncbi:hypothetical protein T440DRAFT_246554 [Plenodomus tracheiphilus IPT5]|uniref:Uncharacterized protein n=1 Tax=Plenodomus tracheiphilus IPT5 TaxID=1408161 RepID=A0A6A7ATU6_9PLEO|nr:hypothetical protein T440DRAFT_246554 [Plenodomus tracheiphilus IPT5]